MKDAVSGLYPPFVKSDGGVEMQRA